MKKLSFYLCLAQVFQVHNGFKKPHVNENAAIISDQAVESLTNLEYTMALGMAKAALLIRSRLWLCSANLSSNKQSKPKMGWAKIKIRSD